MPTAAFDAARRVRGRSTACVVVASLGGLAALVVLAFLTGSSSVSFGELATWLAGGDVDEAAKSILVNVRLPRVAAALLAGAALAVAGAIIQAVLDNPLASPNVIGVNSGAGLFVLMAAAFFLRCRGFPLARHLSARLRRRRSSSLYR